MAFPDTWSEKALVSVSKKAGSEVAYKTIIETIDIDEGDKNVSQKTNIAGGKLIVKEAQNMTIITLENFPVGIGTTATDNLGFSQLFNAGTWDTSQPLNSSASTSRDLFRVAITWTDSTTATASGAIVTASTGYRYIASNGFLTGLKKSFTDGVLKFTAQFKFPVVNKSGTANITEWDCDTSAQITALVAYT